MALPILHGTFPGGDLYSQALSNAYQQEWRILDPDLSQEREPEIWEKIQRDGRVHQAIHQRCSAVAGGDWIIEPATDSEVDKAAAEIVRDAFKRVENFRESRKKLAHAIFRGRSYGYIEGRRKNVKLGDYPYDAWWCPTKIVDIDKRRFQIVPHVNDDDDGKTQLRVQRQMWSVSQMKWFDLADADLRSIIEVIWGSEESTFHYYGKPLLESLYFLWWAKMICLQEGLTAVERFSGGAVIMELDEANHPAGAGTDAETVRDAYIDELKKMRGEHVFCHAKGDSLSVLQGGGEGQRMVHDFLNYIDGAVMSTALGATLPFGVGEGVGSLARAEVEREVSEGFLQADREMLDSAITNKMVRLFMELNWPNFVKLGLGDAQMPRFVTSQQSREDPNASVGVVASALQAGIDLRKDEVYEAIGYSIPQEGEDVFIGQDPDAMMGGGGFPFSSDRDVKMTNKQGE